MKRAKKLTVAQRRMLEDALRGNPFARIFGMSAAGGATRTAWSLARLGYMTSSRSGAWKVTPKGRAALAVPA